MLRAEVIGLREHRPWINLREHCAGVITWKHHGSFLFSGTDRNREFPKSYRYINNFTSVTFPPSSTERTCSGGKLGILTVYKLLRIAWTHHELTTKTVPKYACAKRTWGLFHLIHPVSRTDSVFPCKCKGTDASTICIPRLPKHAHPLFFVACLVTSNNRLVLSLWGRGLVATFVAIKFSVNA